MNEHIKALWIKSGVPQDVVMDIHYGKPVILDEAHINWFAELIVKECANVADNPDVDMLRVGKVIKEHFGVE
jgi:hypothetical protein